MALIICRECKANISQYAATCPQCGCPNSTSQLIDTQTNGTSVTAETTYSNYKLWTILAGIGMFFAIIYFFPNFVFWFGLSMLFLVCTAYTHSICKSVTKQAITNPSIAKIQATARRLLLIPRNAPAIYALRFYRPVGPLLDSL